MRDVINKNHTEEELLNSVRTAAREGYTSAKLYFMCGLPSETDDDLRAILDLPTRRGRPRATWEPASSGITASVSPHVPKPHTPFAWAEQVSTAELNRRLGVLRDAARGKPVTLKYRDAETSLLEGVFTRGDRRLGSAVEDAWRRGCRFDAWTEHLRWATWMDVFADHGMDPERFLIERSTELDQPWDVIVSPVTRKFLVREKMLADRAGITDDCRLEDKCFSCGVEECPQRPWVKQPHAKLDLDLALSTCPKPDYGRRRRGGGASTALGVGTSLRFRLQFEKGSAMRFISHLDLMRTWERTLRRAGLPLAFTQGHHPHLKMSFGPPLPLGYRSRSEVFDLEFSKPPGVDLAERLNAVLPDGLRVSAFRPILFKTPSLMSQLEGASYRVRFPRGFLEEAGTDPAQLRACLATRVPALLQREHVIVQRTSDSSDPRIRRQTLHRLARGVRGADLSACSTWDCASRPARRRAPTTCSHCCSRRPTPASLDVERTGLWAARSGALRDPLQLLSPGQDD